MAEKLNVELLRTTLASQDISISRLAETSRVSRPQLSRILSGQVGSVRESTIQRLATALAMTPQQLTLGGELREYRDFVAKAHEKLGFRGIGMPHFEQQPIEEVFVDLTVREDARPDDDCRTGCAAPTSPRWNLAATECVQTQDRVVLLGHPGGGKTTLLRFLAHKSARRSAETDEVPLYLRLAEFSRAQELDERVDLLGFVAARAADSGCGDVEKPLRKALSDHRRRCLVMLDGLDEVGGHEKRDRLIKAVKAFVRQYPENRYVITSRVVGFESGPWSDLGFSVFRVLGYSRKQLKAFAEKWAALLARILGESREEVAAQLETAIFSNPRVRALASNPLVLTILVLLTGARGGTLPRRRVDLYEKVVDVFLDTWEKTKHASDRFDATHSIDLDSREFRWLLSDLALAMQKADRTLAPRWWLAARMRAYLQEKLGFESDDANDICDRVIRYLAERSGLIEERGPDLFGFTHRTLQEYFASLGVVDEADASQARNVSDGLRSYFFHPSWCEVVRLVAAQLTPPLAESLVSSLVDDPDPVGRFLKRGPLLALKCLSDGTTVANRRLVSSIFETLADLGRSKWLGIALEAFDVLESLDGTRLESQAEDAVAAILSTAKAELDPEEYECLFYWGKLRERLKDQHLPEFRSEAAIVVPVEDEGKERAIPVFNASLLMSDPEAWYKSACCILEDDRQAVELKEGLVRELGRRAGTDPRARMRLLRILANRDAPRSLRLAAASGLASAAKGRHKKARLLLRVLRQDHDDGVRAACASSLGDAAADDEAIRDELERYFAGGFPLEVRSGAAHGLSVAAACDSRITEMLLEAIAAHDAPNELQMACAWALRRQLGEHDGVTSAFKSWLDAPVSIRLQRVAAQCLAGAMANESVPWDHRVVERVEHVLISLGEPCPHALECLRDLATARAVRGGLRLESVLADALKPSSDRMEVAFVFGSTARNRQTEDSDIDLFLMGDIGLKDLSVPLRSAESVLGRRINPVIYTRESFRQKFQAGDPFLLDVYRREKIPIVQRGTAMSREGLDDELRAMVAERLAPTV